MSYRSKNMRRIKEEQFDFLRLNNLQDKVNFNKKTYPSGVNFNDELMMFLWELSVEKEQYWSTIHNKLYYFLFRNGQIYV